MVETISPVVYGTRTRWAGALALHAAGATATAAAFGAAVAAAAALLGAPWGRAGVVVVAAVAVLYLVRELTGIRMPVPQLRRQVPGLVAYVLRPTARRVPLRRADWVSASSRSSATGRSWWSRSARRRPADRSWGRS